MMSGGGGGNISNNPKNFVDVTSPYFLHPSDNTSAIISSCILKGNNYETWQKAM